MVFINLPVHELARSKQFFNELGFSFDSQYSDEKAACMVINDKAFAMLLEEPFFRTFTMNEPCDTKHSTEGLFALSCSSREEVDEMVNRAVAAGGSHAMPPNDYGFMYSWSFYDPDHHHWEVFWMDVEAHSREMAKQSRH